MYAPSWLSGQSLTDSLLHKPWRWQSLQALRVVEQSGQPCRFISAATNAYPFADLSQVQRTAEGWTLTSTLPTLTGFYGVLPYVYQDIEQQQRLSLDDGGMRGFFSIFNDRILSLIHTIYQRSNLSTHYEQCARKGLAQAHWILALSGLPIPKHIPPDNIVRYSGALASKTTSLELLTSILTDYFSLAFRLEPPPVVRMPLADDCLTRLYTDIDRQTQRLGESTLIGRSCYLLHSCVNVVILVNTAEEYQAVVYDKTLAPAVLEMCALYFATLARFRLQIQCPRYCLESPRLSVCPGQSVARLGRFSCLRPEWHPERFITMDFPQSGLLHKERSNE